MLQAGRRTCVCVGGVHVCVRVCVCVSLVFLLAVPESSRYWRPCVVKESFVNPQTKIYDNILSNSVTQWAFANMHIASKKNCVMIFVH